MNEWMRRSERSSYDTISPMQRIRRFLDRQPTLTISIVLFVVAALFFLPTVWFGFITLDDGLLILNNKLIQSFNLSTLKLIFTSFDPELYVPLTTLSFNLSYMIGGLEPWIYHLCNVLLFALNVALVFAVTEKLSQNRWIGLLTALLFLLHPINVEAVAWASARKDLLSASFFLASVLCWLRTSGPDDRRWYIASIVCFTLALLSKVTAVTLPLVLILLELRPYRERTPKQIAVRTSPFFVLSIIFGLIAIFGKSRNIVQLTTLQTFLLATKSAAFMVWKILLPVDLSVLYPQSGPIGFTAFLLPIAVSAILLGIVIVALIRKQRVVVLCLLFTLITFAPNIFTFVKNGELYFFSDRYAYLSTIGLFLLSASAISRLHVSRPAIASSVTLIILLILGTASQVQAQVWRDSFTLLTHAVAIYPDSGLAHSNLGSILMGQGDDAGALKEFDLALTADPHLMNAWINRGNIFARRGDLAAAAESDQSAIKAIDNSKPIRPDDLLGFYAIGERLEKEGKIDASLKQFTDAAALAPSLAEPQYNAAVMLHKYEKLEQAAEYYTRAVALDPRMLDARYALASLLAGRGLLPEAAVQLKAIIAIDPNYAEAALHLQKINEMIGQGGN